MKLKVGEIVSKCRSHEALHVLEKERSRSQSPNRAHELRNHVTVIAHAPMLAAYAEGLARRTSSDEIDLTELLVPEFANVVLDHLPVRDPGNRPFFRVMTQGRTGIAVPLDEGRVAESPMMSAQGQAPGTRKQLKGSESIFFQIDAPPFEFETLRVRDGMKLIVLARAHPWQ